MNLNDIPEPRARDALVPGWTRYQLAPTFSWEWCLRRSRVFLPLAIVYGLGLATWHASGMNDWPNWVGLAWRACLGALVVVSAGPFLAALVRRAGLRPGLEQVLVVLAIGAGLGIARAAAQWIIDYHALLMSLCRDKQMPVGYLSGLLSQTLFQSVNGSSMALVIGAGGFAIVAYLTERRRLADYASRRELEAMRIQRDAAELRLSALQAQVEPHFLFNTLASVRSLVATDPKRAADTIDAMADYFRSTLPSLNADAPRNAS
jgi:hypothetical protein